MQDVSYVRFPPRPLNHQIRILTQRLLMEVLKLHVLSQLCLEPVIAQFFSLSSCRAGKIPLCLSSWATSGDRTRGLQRSLPSYIFPSEEAVTWHSSLSSLSLRETGNLTGGHGTFPFFSPHLSICQKRAFHSGEKRTPVCSVHLRRIPSRRSSMHNMHCCLLSSRRICSGRVKWQPQVEGKFCSKVFVLTKDTEEDGN